MVAVVVPAVLVDIDLVLVGVAAEHCSTLLFECDAFLFHSAMMIVWFCGKGQTNLVPARTSWNSTP